MAFNPIQDAVEGGGAKRPSPLISFPPVFSTSVGLNPQNFLTFSFNPFSTLVLNFKFVPSAYFSPNNSKVCPVKKNFNPIQDGKERGGKKGNLCTKKAIPPGFTPVTSTNVRISPKILVLTRLSLWCKISTSYLVSIPNY